MTMMLVAAAATIAVGTTVTPAAPFTDNMVLQRDMPVPVWGTAQSGETVTVSFGGQTKRCTADTNGCWSVTLDPMEASREPRTLAIGERKIVNVLVGEVWLASGQSNMEDPILSGNSRYRDGWGRAMTALARRSDIRFYTAPHCRMETPNLTQKVIWRDFSTETFKDVDARVPVSLWTKGLVSAVGFYYALALHDAVGVPIGLVDVSWGGSHIEPWIAPDGGMWNGMVAAFAPMACRGFIWYQGCSNIQDGAAYAEKMHALYDSWAAAFRNPEMKMYFVQLAPFNKSWWEIQLAQARFAAEEKNAAMAVVCDLGNSYDIHPNNKEPVARRLALHALKDVYGFDDVIADSPTLKSFSVDEEGRFVLDFNDATAWYGYLPNRAAPDGFEIAGEDGVFHPASIVNELLEKGRKGKMYVGRELIVASDKVKSPKRLRYLYSKPWIGSLYSEDSGLPLGPFEVNAEKTAVVGNGGAGGAVADVPELMKTFDGAAVETVADWENVRAPEIRTRYAKEVFGVRPKEADMPGRVSFAVTDVSEAMDGRAVRKLVTATFKGTRGDFSFPFTVFIPKCDVPVPAFVFICNRPRSNIDPDRADRSGFWPAEEIVARGYATIAFQSGDVAADDKTAGFDRDVFKAFQDAKDRSDESWGAISAWAWGASRIMDWIETEPLIDSRHVGVVGHSRGGKTAIWAGVTDSRFAMVCSNDSGCSGAKLNHMPLPKSESIAQITSKFPHWFCRGYSRYAGREMEMDFDQHELLALVAPRLLCVASASEDAWAGQEGEWCAAKLASPAWELYGKKGLVADRLPAPETPQQDGEISYHLRTGRHDLTPNDWTCYMDFADRHGWRTAAAKNLNPI